jgi:hypothetical protein
VTAGLRASEALEGILGILCSMRLSLGLKWNEHSWMCISWEGCDVMRCGLSVWFCPTDSSLTPQQMVGVGLGSIVFVIVLAFLSFSAVWYVGLSFLRN